MLPFFPDLERRFFQKDVSWVEKERILDEALRLREGQGPSLSELSALDRFIDVARVVLCRPDLVDPPLVGQGSELPLALRVPIASMILQRMPLTHEWLFSWWACDGREGRGPSDRVCEDEFRALFALRFAERFPRGLPLAGPMPRLAPFYRAASGTFETPVDLTPYGGPLFDISNAREPLGIAREIAMAAARDLEALNAFLARTPSRRGSAEAYSLLPTELRPYFPSRAVQEFTGWARARIAAGGRTPLDELILRLRGARPERMGRPELVELAEALARLGFGIAPDARVSPRLPAPEEPVVLFAATNAETSGSPGRALRAGIERLTLAAALAGGSEAATAEPGLRAIAAEAKAGLSGRERDRLDATLGWLRMVEPDLAPVRTLLRAGGPEAEESVRELIAAVHGAGKAAEEVGRTLGLAPMPVPAAQSATGPTPPTGQALPPAAEPGPEPIPDDSPEPSRSGEPETISGLQESAESGAEAEKEKSFPAPEMDPPGPGPTGGFQLDPVELERKRRETERAKKALDEALSEPPGARAHPAPPSSALGPTSPPIVVPAQAPTPSPVDPPLTAASGRFRGLDASAARLAAELIGWGRWSELEFEALARRHRVMPDGIVEILNEWSVERFQEPFVEVYEGYALSPSVIAKLSSEA